MSCTGCAGELLPGAKFCPNCEGAPLGDVHGRLDDGLPLTPFELNRQARERGLVRKGQQSVILVAVACFDSRRSPSGG